MATLFKKRLHVCFVLFCISLHAYEFSCAAIGADAPLTLVQAQSIAVARSRQLVAQDMSVQSSQEMAMAASQLPDPVVKIGVDNLPVNGADRFSVTDDFMTMRRVGVMQEFTASDKRQARAEIYERTADKSRAEKIVTIAGIQRDTALAWLDCFYAQQWTDVITEQVAQSRLEILAAESAYRSGRGNQSDIFSARSALVLMEDRASEIHQRLNNARTALARWIGNAAEQSLADLPDMQNITLDSTLLESQLEHHPQIDVLNQQVNIAQADARLAQANKSTDWSVGLNYQQRGSAYSNMLSIEVSIPLQWDQKNRQNRELYAKQAVVEQASAERDEALRRHVAETRTLLSDWQINRERLARFESELLPLSQQRIQATLAAYRGSKASLADLLAARRNEIDVRTQYLQLQTDTARLWAQLNFLTPRIFAATVKKEFP